MREPVRPADAAGRRDRPRCRPRVRFAETRFSDVQPSPLKHWRDFAGGVEQVVGTSVDVTLAQAQSADGFATPVTIGYQFIVESP